MPRTFFFTAVSLGLALMAPARQSPAQPSAPPAKIGIMVELSGYNAMNGERCRQGFEAARETSPHTAALDFIYEDHGGDARTGVAAFKKLTGINKALAVITTRSQVGMAVNPLSAGLKIPLLGIIGHPDFLRLNPYAMRLYPSVQQEGESLAQAVWNAGYRRVAEINLQDEWNKSLAQAFEQALRRRGAEVVFADEVLATETDFSTLLTRLAAHAPDAVFVNSLPGQTGTLVRRMRELGMRQALLSNFWGATEEAQEIAGAANMRGMFFVTVNLNKPAFRALVLKRSPQATLSAVTYCCFAATRAVTEASARAAQSRAPLTAHSLFAALLELREIKLPDETLPVKEREVQFDVVVERVR